MGWRLLRADRLHFMTCSHRRSTAPRSGLRLHCDEKPCAPGERLPLKRRDRCLHSGKKTQTYLFYLTDPVWLQSHRNIRRAGDVRLKPRVVILRRHSACHLIFYLHEVGEVGPVRVLRIEISCTWTRGVFFSLISHDSTDSPAAPSFCVFSGLTLFIVRDLLLHRPTINRETCFCCSHHRTSPGGAVTSLQTRYIQRFSSSSRGKKMSPSSSGAGPVFVTATLLLARSNETNPPEYL